MDDTQKKLHLQRFLGREINRRVWDTEWNKSIHQQALRLEAKIAELEDTKWKLMYSQGDIPWPSEDFDEKYMAIEKSLNGVKGELTRVQKQHANLFSDMLFAAAVMELYGKLKQLELNG